MDKYEQQGLSARKAREKANRALREQDMRGFLSKYASLLSYIFKLRGGFLHGKIISTVDEYLEQKDVFKKSHSAEFKEI